MLEEKIKKYFGNEHLPQFKDIHQVNTYILSSQATLDDREVLCRWAHEVWNDLVDGSMEQLKDSYDLFNAAELASISQRQCQHDNLSITLYEITDDCVEDNEGSDLKEGDLIIWENLVSESRYYRLAKRPNGDDDYLEAWASRWAENQTFSDERLERVRWGLDEIEDYEAHEDLAGAEYKIVVEYSMADYNPVKFALDEDGEDLVFRSVKEAQEWINKMESDQYVCGHNEMDRPHYTIWDV